MTGVDMGKHIPALDGIRGAAVLIVMCAHYFALFNIGHGSLGVDIFFVLSGFLITSILVDEFDTSGTISFRNFYMRRILRLAPALLVMVFLFAALDLLLRIWPPDLVLKSGVIAIISYPSNWVRASNSWNMIEFGHTWSLAIEDQFYLVWPVALFAFLKLLPNRSACAALVFFIAVGLAAYRAYGVLSGFPDIWISAATHMRSDALLVGCTAGLCRPYLNNDKAKRVLTYAAQAAAAAIVAVLIVRRDYHLWQEPVAVMATAIILLHLATGTQSWLSSAFSRRWLTETGKISYGLYLYHYPMVYLAVYCTALMKLPTDIKQAICIFILMPLSFCLATLSYRYLESPILKLKSRFTPSAEHELPSPLQQFEDRQGSPPRPLLERQFATTHP